MRSKGLLQKNLFSIAILMAGLLLIEAAFYLWNSYNDDVYVGTTKCQKHHSRYYRLEKNSVQYAKHEDLPIRNELRVNSIGLADDEISKEKPQQLFRVAVIGDSFVLSRTLAKKDRPASVMQELLQKKMPDKQVEVINCGLDGYGPAQEYILYKEVVEDLSPDVVICVHFQNDLSDMFYNNIFKIEGGRLVNNRNLFPFESSLNELSTSKFIADRLNNISASEIESAGYRTEFENDTWQTYKLIMQRFKNEVEANGAKFLSVLAPRQNYFLSPEKFKEKFDLYENKVLEVHMEIDLPTLQLSKGWSKLDSNRLDQIFFKYDLHWSEAGCYQVAVETLNFMNGQLNMKFSQIQSKLNPGFPSKQVPYINVDDKKSYIMARHLLGTYIDPSVGSFVLNGRIHITDAFDLSALEMSSYRGTYAAFFTNKAKGSISPEKLFGVALSYEKIKTYDIDKFHSVFLKKRALYEDRGFRVFTSSGSVVDIFFEKQKKDEGASGVIYIHEHPSNGNVQGELFTNLKEQILKQEALGNYKFSHLGICFDENRLNLSFYINGPQPPAKFTNSVVRGVHANLDKTASVVMDYFNMRREQIDSIEADFHFTDTSPWHHSKRDSVKYVKIHLDDEKGIERSYVNLTFTEWHIHPYTYRRMLLSK